MEHNKAPLVSVVMPAYNAEKYIKEAIESILNQSYKNFEFIIVDDASTDKTWEIIEDFAKKDKRIRTYRNKQNLYIALNRNKGLSYAKGKYIVWQDADDISLPKRIEHQVKYMEANPKVGISGGYIQSFNEIGDLDIRKYETNDKSLRSTIFKFSPVAQPAGIIKRECFDKVGLYNPDYPPAEDIEMSFRIGAKYNFGNIPEVVIRYREHQGGATMNKMKKILRSTYEARKKHANGYGYKMTLSDKLALYVTYLMQYIPPKLTIFAFKLARNIILIFKKIQ